MISMKKVLTLLVFVIVSLGKNENVFAQVDSVKVEYKQENKDSSDFFVRRKYKYLDILLKDEKNLMKLGIEPSIVYTEMKFKIFPHLVFEKKISPAWSVIFEDIIELSVDNRPSEHEISSDVYLMKDRLFKNTLNIGTRYYYGMKQAIQEKTSGNNFSSNYFELTLNGFPSVQRYNRTIKVYSDIDNFTLIQKKGTEVSYEFSAQASWGIQRRLSNYSFVDAKLTANFCPLPGFRTDNWYVGINIIFGFGYNVKRK